jgi:RNA-binding protein
MTGKQKAHLRSLGQTLEPAVRVGKEGVTHEVERALARALGSSELVKVKFQESREAMDAQAEQLATRTSATIVGEVGRTALFYRQAELVEERTIFTEDVE